MSRCYAITGGAAGIGAAIHAQLRARGDKVIVVDIKEGDITADLSCASGRQWVLKEINRLAPEGLNGFIPCAGLGPHVTPVPQIARVNFFGAVELVMGLKPLLEKRRGSAVLISSNSASLPGRHEAYVKALLEMDEKKASDIIAPLDGQTAYGGSKYALAVWMRKNAPEYMRSGIRMNAVAPGITQTAMTDGVFADPSWGGAIKQFSAMTPFGQMATPDMIADPIQFLIDPCSQFVCGSVLFVDGGTDALLRPEGF